MEGIIIYKGKYSATEDYAHILQRHLQLPVYSIKEANNATIKKADYIIIGSSVYVGAIGAKMWIEEHKSLLISKKLFFFIVCATPGDQTEKLAEIIRHNIPETLRISSSVYFLMGRLNKKKLSWKDWIILHMGAWMQKDPAGRKRMLQDFDAVDQKNLYPLIDAVNKYKKEQESEKEEQKKAV